jgi:hypothetical protein
LVTASPGSGAITPTTKWLLNAENSHRKKAVAPSQLFLGGVFEVGKTFLHAQLSSGGVPILSQNLQPKRFRVHKSAFPLVFENALLYKNAINTI